MKKVAFLVGIAFVLFSCNSGNNESSSSNSDKSAETLNKSYDCLKEYQEDYSGLLTKEDMTAVYSFDLNTAKVELRPGNYGRHIYSWLSDRPDLEYEVSGMKLKGPDRNTMGVALLSFYSDDSDMKSTRKLFDRGYKQLSEKELKEIENNLSKQNNEIKKTGKDMMKVRKKSNWDFVENIGSSSWYKWNNQFGGELAVLAGKAKFYIRLKISDDPQENLEVAKKLAEKVLAKCD